MPDPSDSNDQKTPQQVKRSVGLLALTFMAVGGILGSGWLFIPLLTAQLAGPASLVAWGIGAVAMILLANSFAEVAAVLPVPGGIARIPRFTHGDITSAVIGWTAWVGYCTQAPIEVAVMLQYADVKWPWLFHGAASLGNLTFEGFLVAGGFLLFFVFINALGAAAFARANTAITWVKLVIPIVIVLGLMATYFDAGNFTNSSHGGFAPYGMKGILAAVSSGGIIFALIGFRHAIDMAGEAKNPRVTVPLSLLLGLIIPVVIYFLIQIAFLGALSPSELDGGWAGVHASSELGPLSAVIASLGIHWLMAAVYGGVIVGPLGGGLVATGSNARLALALARNRFIPALFQKLSKNAVPVYALILNFVVGMVLLFFLPFREIVAVNSASITLSFTAGPLAVYALRKQLPNVKRMFKIPAMSLQAVLGFVVATMIVYWSGWKTNIILTGIIFLAVGVLLFKRVIVDKKPLSSLDSREALWIIPYVTLFMTVSYLGNFGGGRGIIPFGMDMLIIAVASTIIFYMAIWCRLSNEDAKLFRDRYKERYSPIGTDKPSEEEPW